MKYLFFDIECANYVNDNFTICTFGYTLTNEKFEIIQKKDILINPNSTFNPIVLNKIIHYKPQDFLNKPTFDQVYPFLSKLLLDKDTVCFGYDVGNDLRFLNGECNRYNLPMLDLKAYDIQYIYKLVNELSSPLSLSKAALTLNIDLEKMELHNSKDDSLITMLIAKSLVKKTNKSLKFLSTCNESICIDSSHIVNPNKSMHGEIKQIVNKYPNRDKSNSICLSEDLELIDRENAYTLIRKILEAGFNYTSKVYVSRIYVSDTNDDPRDEKYDKCELKRPGKIKKVTKNELLDYLEREYSIIRHD